MISVRDEAAIRYLAKRDYATRDELDQFYPCRSTTRYNIWNLMKQGVIEKIRTREVFQNELRENIPIYGGKLSGLVYKEIIKRLIL